MDAATTRRIVVYPAECWIVHSIRNNSSVHHVLTSKERNKFNPKNKQIDQINLPKAAMNPRCTEGGSPLTYPDLHPARLRSFVPARHAGARTRWLPRRRRRKWRRRAEEDTDEMGSRQRSTGASRTLSLQTALIGGPR